MKMQRVDTYGSAWQCLDPSIGCPTIYGLVQRDQATVTGIVVGVTATSTSTTFNSAEVVADPDSVSVPRLPGEPIYVCLEDSLVQRVAQLHGTSRAWALEYA